MAGVVLKGQYMWTSHNKSFKLNNSIDGRFLISNTFYSVDILDMFHSKTIKLRPIFLTTTVDQHLKELTGRYWVQDIFGLDLYTALVLFREKNDVNCYLGIGKIELERQLLIVKQKVKLDNRYVICSWIPYSYPPQLTNGFTITTEALGRRRLRHFNVKMQDNGQLQVSPRHLPIETIPFKCDGAVLYGLARNNNNQSNAVDLVKLTLSNGEYMRDKTDSRKLENGVEFDVRWNHIGYMACMRRSLFFCNPRSKNDIITLNLDSLKWERTNIELDSIRSVRADGNKTLIVSTGKCWEFAKVYRFVINEHDKLSDLVWMQLKRIFDAQPSSYKFILSELPTNFKQKCPFPPPNKNTARSSVTTKKKADTEDSGAKHPSTSEAKRTRIGETSRESKKSEE